MTEREYKYTPPQESNDDPELYHHKLSLEIEGEQVAEITVTYMNKPFPFYYAEYLSVNDKEQGKGYGKELLQKFNKFLDDKGKVGILCDTIDPAVNPEAVGMYERNGWSRISEGEDWFVYHKSQRITHEMLEKAIREIKGRRWEYASLMSQKEN